MHKRDQISCGDGATKQSVKRMWYQENRGILKSRRMSYRMIDLPCLYKDQSIGFMSVSYPRKGIDLKMEVA